MDLQEAKKIIKTEFPGHLERIAYCPHCLNPMRVTTDDTGAEEENFLDSLGYIPICSEDYRLGVNLHKALPTVFPPCVGDEVKAPPHECPDCPLWEGAAVRPGAMLGAFGPDEKVAYCPTCMLPMHKGEGPLTAEGYRAELLRRLFPGSLEITPELFRGGTLGVQPPPRHPVPMPLAMRIDMDWKKWVNV